MVWQLWTTNWRVWERNNCALFYGTGRTRYTLPLYVLSVASHYQQHIEPQELTAVARSVSGTKNDLISMRTALSTQQSHIHRACPNMTNCKRDGKGEGGNSQDALFTLYMDVMNEVRQDSYMNRARNKYTYFI
jgi:hypothetical protein